jgi:hypothetical protein
VCYRNILVPGQPRTTAKPPAIPFDVYGFRFSLSGDPAIDTLAEDLAFFRREAVDRPMKIVLCRQAPAYQDVPQRPASVYTPRNVALTENGRTFIHYGGRALAIYDRAEPSFCVQSLETDMLYEATYLFLLSRIGEFLDARHMHRIRAMALAYCGKAILAVLPMGGGKSTLAAELLKCPDFDFLSDDSPFIARDGRVYAFPLRLGLPPGAESEFPPECRRTINRMEFGPKVLLNYAYFASRVKPSADPGIVFLGCRSLAPACRIEPCGTMESYRSMIANCVIGLGLFQGLEFVVRSNAIELAAKARVGASRLRNARRLFRRSRVYRLILGRDRVQNAQAVIDFVRKQLQD